MFRTVSLSIIRSLALYTQQYIQDMLLASSQHKPVLPIFIAAYNARLLMMDRETVRNM